MDCLDIVTESQTFQASFIPLQHANQLCLKGLWLNRNIEAIRTEHKYAKGDWLTSDHSNYAKNKTTNEDKLKWILFTQ